MDNSQDTPTAESTGKKAEGEASEAVKNEESAAANEAEEQQAGGESAGEQDSTADSDQAAQVDESAEAGGETSDQDLASQLEALNEQLLAAKDAELRVQAEMQNLRRRAERDVENAHKFGLEKLINGLLPVLDNFDRALSAVPEEAAAESDVLKGLLEGVELTRKSAIDVLKGFSVDVLEPYGEPFDPQFHEAMTMVPSAMAEPNSIIDVLQKGYTLNGRLLRAAMVVVAKAAE